jgi:hypothetical protein
MQLTKSMDSENKSEVIIELGAEGGSIILYGLETERGWTFRTETQELIEEERIESKSPVVNTWEAALQLLDKYPWPKLCPISIHPQFRSRIWRAMQERMTSERWREICRNKLFFGRGETRSIIVCTDLRDCLPADKKHHFRDGFSMAEAAKSWVAAGGCLPPSIAKVVGSPELIAAHFEYPTEVWGGGTAMTDIMAFVPDGVVAVEAKMNEPFDDVIYKWIYKEMDKNERSPPHRTKVVQRYAEAFGLKLEQLLEIRYQLLQRTLSAALTAQKRGVSKAWMVVQSFVSPAGTDGYYRNRRDFNRFIDLVGDAPTIENVRVKLAWVSDDPRNSCCG